MKKLILSSLAAACLYAAPNTLVFARGADSSLLDPAHVTDVESIYVTRNIFDTLVRFKKGSTEIEPALAERYEISPDGLSYTFYLRKGVYFAPTKYFNKLVELKADDVVFSLKRQFDRSNPYYSATGTYDYWAAMDMDNIVKDVIKIDDYTVRIDLKKIEAPFLADIAMDFAGIVCKEYADELLKQNKAENLNRFPIGTGPYSLVSWKKDEAIVLASNDKYWDEVPHIKRLIIKVVPNDSVRAAELKAKQSHIIERASYADLNELKKDPSINVAAEAGANVQYVSLNTNNKILSNALVRQAINYAVNKEAIVQAVYDGYAQAAYSPIPPSMWSYTNDLVKYEYDLQKAKQLLELSGYAAGFRLNLISNPTSERKKIAEMIQADLAKIGIKVDIQMYDFTTYLNKSKQLEADMVIAGWQGDNGDPDNFLNILLSKAAAKLPAGNFAAWVNDEFDGFIQKAKQNTNFDERKMLYQHAQQIFAKEVPWINISYTQNVVPMLSNVAGLDINTISGMRFNSVYFKDEK